MSEFYLPPGLAAPRPARDGIDAPYWQGLREERLLIQRCRSCARWQWGPEWICHRCHSFDVEYQETAPEGRVFSYERVWHPVHRALEHHGPYLVVVVDLPAADHVRLIGNLLGDPTEEVAIGAPVAGVFEHHRDAEPPYTLLQWRRLFRV